MTTPTDEKSLLDFFADFSLTIGGLTAELKATRIDRLREEQKRLNDQARVIPLERMSSPSIATDFQDFGGPQPGRFWDVRLLTAFASPLAANAAQITWYVGQRIGVGPGAGMLPATWARWQFPSVPAFKDFSPEVIRIFPGQYLIAGLTGVPAASNIGLSATIADQPQYTASTTVGVS